MEMPMTEVEWNNSTQPDQMLAFLYTSGRANARKLRLFGVACCRHIWHLLVDEWSQVAVMTGERFADQVATEGERDTAFQAAADACHPPRRRRKLLRATGGLLRLLCGT